MRRAEGGLEQEERWEGSHLDTSSSSSSSAVAAATAASAAAAALAGRAPLYANGAPPTRRSPTPSSQPISIADPETEPGASSGSGPNSLRPSAHEFVPGPASTSPTPGAGASGRSSSTGTSTTAAATAALGTTTGFSVPSGAAVEAAAGAGNGSLRVAASEFRPHPAAAPVAAPAAAAAEAEDPLTSQFLSGQLIATNKKVSAGESVSERLVWLLFARPTVASAFIHPHCMRAE